MTKEELKKSLDRQLRVLNKDGILFHTFWCGDEEEIFSGLRFVYYTKETFAQVVGPEYEIVASERYPEMEENDSIYFVVKKR